MAANVTLRVAKSAWVKAVHLKESSDCFSVVHPMDHGMCFPLARCSFPGRACSPSSRTKCSSTARGHQPAHSLGQKPSGVASTAAAAWGDRGAAAAAALGLIISSLGDVRATHMVASLFWIYKILYLRLCNQSPRMVHVILCTLCKSK